MSEGNECHALGGILDSSAVKGRKQPTSLSNMNERSVKLGALKLINGSELKAGSYSCTNKSLYLNQKPFNQELGSATNKSNSEEESNKMECFKFLHEDHSKHKSLTKLEEMEAVKFHEISSKSIIPDIPLETIECVMCDQKFCSMTMLDIHIKSHPDATQFQCPKCPTIFNKRYSLSQHLLTHVEIRNYTCNECSKSFKRKGDLVQHLKIHTGDRAWKCDYCEKTFLRSSHLYQHQRTHSGERQAFYREYKPYKCTHCGRNFHRKSDMEAHVMTHTDERPHRCPVCGKGFRRQFHLKQHMPVHTNERNFMCMECNKTFIRQNELHVHIQKHKDSVKMIVCDLCDAVYQTQDEFQRHKLRHGNEKLMCSECGELFTDKKALEDHKQEEHSICLIK